MSDSIKSGIEGASEWKPKGKLTETGDVVEEKSDAKEVFETWKAYQKKPVIEWTVDLDWAKAHGIKLEAGPNMGVALAARLDLTKFTFDELPCDWKDYEAIFNLINPEEQAKPSLKDLFFPKS